MRVGVRTPRITTHREWAASRRLLEQLAPCGPDAVLVHHMGTLRLAREVCPEVTIIADFGLNVLNSSAVALLGELGARQVTVSNEAGLTDLHALAGMPLLPLEILAHGPITGMLMEHCLIALHVLSEGRKDVCRGPCRHASFGLKYACGQVRPIVTDSCCRNHLLTGHGLAILPALETFVFPGIGSLRIEGPFYPAALVGAITQAYRWRLDSLGSTNGRSEAWRSARDRVQRTSPRPLNFGPYVRSIVQSRTTAEVMKDLVSL